MNMNNIVNYTRRVILLVALLILFFGCIAYVGYVYYGNIYPNKLAKKTYEQSICTINNSKLVTKGELIPQYRADFWVSYTAQGIQYRNVLTSGTGLDGAFTTDQQTQRRLLNQLTIGSKNPCWYDPADPRIVLVVLRHNWSSMFSLFIPIILAFISLYYFGRGIFDWMTERKISV